MSNKIKSLRESIRRTGIASTAGLKKQELINLRHKLQAYGRKNDSDDDDDNDNDNNNKSRPSINNDSYKKIKFDKHIELTDEQHKIVTADKNSHYKIIACAGSGKTTTVLCRIKYLIDSGVKPYQILLTTFNVDAAENMKNKMFELFGFRTSIYVGTIDAIAYRFYNAYFKRSDFVGVSEYCTELLKFLRDEKSEKAQKLKSKFEYVFFDEFQDCNDVQFEIIKEFAKTSRVTVIGDDAQNIYQWRGSNIDFILNFENYMKFVKTCVEKSDVKSDTKSETKSDKSEPLGCQIMTLKKNFRSTPEIINLANASIRNNLDQIPKDMISVKKSYNRFPKIYRYSNEEEQAKYVVAYIVQYVKNKIPQEQIAVLSRNNYSIKYVEEEIEKYNIKQKKIHDQDIQIDPHINYVALISDDTRDTKPKIMKDHVTLTTIHKSKGLEWDVVFVLSCNDDKFPSETTQIKLQEDRRLFYVATTRAKRYLNYSFTGKTITRFIGELDKSLYSIVGSNILDENIFKYKNNRSIKFKNGVTQLIEMLEPHDIEQMRKSGLFPSIIPHTYKVHKNHTYSDYIGKYYLQSDYGTYIDRYITRSLGIVVPGCGGLIDSVANRVLNTINMEKPLYDLYVLYNHNIQKKIDLYHEFNNLNYELNNINNSSILKLIDKNINDPEYIKKIDDAHKKTMLKIIDLLIERSNQLKIYPSQVFVVPSNYMPYEFREKFENSYKRFRKANDNEQHFDDNDNKQHTDENKQHRDRDKTSYEARKRNIRRDVYNVSLCQNVFDGRRRLLYKDCFDEFDTDPELYEDIDAWTSGFRSKNIYVKTFLLHKNLGICGETDLIVDSLSNCDNDRIIDFKCSITSECKLEWIIQLMMYSALYKHIRKKTINNLAIYNPLRGTVTEIDLESWNRHEELLEFMDSIRTIRMNEK
jgi:hypothetical protein